eukprot:106923-Chlamydomonas_euryale.AAC.1
MTRLDTPPATRFGALTLLGRPGLHSRTQPNSVSLPSTFDSRRTCVRATPHPRWRSRPCRPSVPAWSLQSALMTAEAPAAGRPPDHPGFSAATQPARFQGRGTTISYFLLVANLSGPIPARRAMSKTHSSPPCRSAALIRLQRSKVDWSALYQGCVGCVEQSTASMQHATPR